MARPLTSTNNSDRLGPVARPGAEDRPPSMSLAQGIGNGTRAWADSGHIWSQGLGSSTRDSSRTRDTSSFLASRDNVNGNSTTSSFGQPLNTDVWNRQRTGWDANGLASQNRSSGVSPVRRGSGVGLLEGSQPLPSTGMNGARATNGLYGNAAPYGPRHSEGGLNGVFGHFARSSNESSQPQDSLNSWPDGGSVHSPTDDRRSVANSDYISSSIPPSRNSSLPPSRHGNETISWPTNESTFGRYGSARGHTPSISSLSGGRYAPERQDSVRSENLPQLLGRVSLDGESDPLAPFQRQVLNPQSPTQPLASSMGALYLQALQDSQAGERPAQGPGSFTPDSAPTFNNNTFSRQPFERSAFTPGTNDFRQSSYLSTNSTPSVIDGPYSHSSHQGRLSASANPALLERRLRVVQQEQTNGLHPHIPFQPSALNPYRQHYGLNGYTSPYGLPNSLPLNVLNLPSHLAGYSQANMYQMLEAPRGLREGEGMTLQSQLLAEFKANNNKGNKQWQLKDIQGHVVEFCGDQLGSRFIQTKLETANSDEKQLVFNEILPDVIQLMQDVFGNYVIQKFFDHGDQTQKGQIAAAMKGHLIELSMQMYACRVVQKAIDHILTSQQAALIKEMEPHVIRCVKDMNGNHVIQKAIERIPAEHIQFIVDSFTGKVGELATHCYGCRVIQRVLEYCTEPVKRTILTELHSFGPTLITDQYGNYVTQHMIVHGFPEDRERMIEQVKANVMLYSRHKFASNVVEKCLTHGSTKQRREILMVVIESSSELGSGLLQLIKDQYGNYVVQKMLETLPGDDYSILVEKLKPEVQKAKRNVAGKHIVAVEKKMQRSSRSNSIQLPVHPPPGATTVGASPGNPSLPRTNLTSPATDATVDRSQIGPTLAPRAPVPLNHGQVSARQPMAI